MARFKDMPMDPAQMVLYASSVDEAVPADSDVRGFRDVMECLDYSNLISKCSSTGRPPYHPEVMVKILGYAYSKGIRGSRRIEELLRVDVRLCCEAGLVRLSVVATDGTKIACAASKRRVYSESKLTFRGSVVAQQREAMHEKLQSPEGKALYALRQQTVEPVFGQLKSNLGLSRFLCWGRAGATAEIALACLAHNVAKCAANALTRAYAANISAVLGTWMLLVSILAELCRIGPLANRHIVTVATT